MTTLSIGQLAREAGVGVETVRFYEREGLLAEPERRPSGYRRYELAAADTLRFIRRAKQLGFTLREIKELLSLRLDAGASRAKVRSLALVRLSDIDARIADLKRMRSSLQHLVDQCDGTGAVSGCPILTALTDCTAN